MDYDIQKIGGDMKGRLLFGLLIIATLMIWMYFDLTQKYPALISGFITMIAVIITHIMNSAEDILAALFKIGESPSPKTILTPSETSVVKIMPIAIFLILISTSCWAYSKPKTTTYVTNTTVNTQVNPTAIVVTEKNIFGPKFEAPRLVHIAGDWYAGIEGGKDVAYTNTSRGWFGFATVSYLGTLLDLSKKSQKDGEQ